MIDCPGCRQRREAMARAARRAGDWLVNRFGPAPDLTADPRAPTESERVERLAILLFLTENKGASENDWRCATDGLRANYHQAVREKMGIKS